MTGVFLLIEAMMLSTDVVHARRYAALTPHPGTEQDLGRRRQVPQIRFCSLSLPGLVGSHAVALPHVSSRPTAKSVGSWARQYPLRYAFASLESQLRSARSGPKLGSVTRKLASVAPRAIRVRMGKHGLPWVVWALNGQGSACRSRKQLLLPRLQTPKLTGCVWESCA
jgi:hypothetical protein